MNFEDEIWIPVDIRETDKENYNGDLNATQSPGISFRVFVLKHKNKKPSFICGTSQSLRLPYSVAVLRADLAFPGKSGSTLISI